MNNLSSYCGLVDAKIRASDKDLPVKTKIKAKHCWAIKFIKIRARPCAIRQRIDQIGHKT